MFQTARSNLSETAHCVERCLENTVQKQTQLSIFTVGIMLLMVTRFESCTEHICLEHDVRNTNM